MGFYFTNDR